MRWTRWRCRYGLHLTDQLSFRVADLSVIGAAMRRLRSAPPATLIGDAVEARDLLPGTDAMVLRTSRLRVVVRPSGTEAKLKCYLELVGDIAGIADIADGTVDLAAHRARLAMSTRSCGRQPPEL